MIGWLVNDCLTCIPGTKTFWHDLLEWIPGLVDKTNGYTEFAALADRVEIEAKSETIPDYIIRNATYFRKINLPCKQISLLQDINNGNMQQLETCNNSTVTVFNSNYTFEQYKNSITKCKIEIIPLGVDFQLFNSLNNKQELQQQLDILPNSVLFVGSSDNYPKGFDVLLNLINTTDYNFCLVMKDGFTISNPRVRVFNKINHETLVKIYNSCVMLLCTSVVETQHLATIEAGACGLPIITTNVGALYNVGNGKWGLKVQDNNYVECIKFVMKNKNIFLPREFLLNSRFDTESCKEKWISVVKQLTEDI
jgi:glycosyltransferase involved in cell wall biosynthesis